MERKIGETGVYRHVVTLPRNTTTHSDTFVESGVTSRSRVKAVAVSVSSATADEVCHTQLADLSRGRRRAMARLAAIQEVSRDGGRNPRILSRSALDQPVRNV